MQAPPTAPSKAPPLKKPAGKPAPAPANSASTDGSTAAPAPVENTIRVEEYRKPEYAVNVKTDRGAYVNGDVLQARDPDGLTKDATWASSE